MSEYFQKLSESVKMRHCKGIKIDADVGFLGFGAKHKKHRSDRLLPLNKARSIFEVGRFEALSDCFQKKGVHFLGGEPHYSGGCAHFRARQQPIRRW